MPNKLPPGQIVGVGSPHSQRMRNWAQSFPVRTVPDDPIVQAHAERYAEMTIGYATGLKELKQRLTALRVSVLKGGSGFPMAQVLRDYFEEYFGRFSRFGLEAMPASFNIVEAFLRISNPLYDFVPREEHEHLLRLYEYFSWFTDSGQATNDPSVLQQVMTDGEIYSYEMTGSHEDFRLATENSEIAIVGISLVRHKHELSVVLLAGEKPPYPSSEDIGDGTFEGVPVKGKEYIVPNPDLRVADRILPSLPGFCRVILLTRIDLTARSYDVRYVNIDVGKSFLVHTDDSSVSRYISREQKENSEVHLRRYVELFSAVAALIYLPVFFIIRQADVVEEKFTTDLGV